MRFKVLCTASILALASLTLWAQVQPPQVLPLPVPGGDVVPPFINQFFPGVGATFDGPNADPHGITNFRGVAAMGYTNGLATDNAGKTYQVITDVRVYQGDYIGAQATFGGGGTTSAKAHGTFVEI
jgi:hypothetical protein